MDPVIEIIREDDIEGQITFRERKKSLEATENRLLWCERFLEVLWWTLITSGVLVFFINLNTDLFSGKEGTHIDSDWENYGNDVKFVYCSSAHTRFNVDLYNEQNNEKLNLTYNSRQQSEEKLELLMKTVSVGDILKYTVNEKDTLHSFSARQLSNDTAGMQHFDGDRAAELMRIENRLIETDICTHYGFPVSRGTIWYADVASGPSNKFQMRTISLSKSVTEKVEDFRAFFAFGLNSTYREYMTSRTMSRGYDYQHNTYALTHLTMSYSTVHNVNTQKLFFKKCFVGKDRYELAAVCVNDLTVLNLERFSPMIMITKDQLTAKTYGLKMLSKNDLRNSTKNAMYRSYIKECNEKYRDYLLCDDFFVRTSYLEKFFRAANDFLTFIDTIAPDYSQTLTHEPLTDLEAYGNGILTMLGGAYGICLTAITLFRWNRNRKHGRFWYFGWKSSKLSPEEKQQAHNALIAHKVLVAAATALEAKKKLLNLEKDNKNVFLTLEELVVATNHLMDSMDIVRVIVKEAYDIDLPFPRANNSIMSPSSSVDSPNDGPSASGNQVAPSRADAGTQTDGIQSSCSASNNTQDTSASTSVDIPDEGPSASGDPVDLAAVDPAVQGVDYCCVTCF